MNITIQKFIIKSMNSPQSGGGGDDDDDVSISSTMTVTPLELLSLDREMAVLYYFIVHQYDAFQNNLNTNINNHYEKFLSLLNHYKKKEENAHNHYFNALYALIPDSDYFFKIYHLENIAAKATTNNTNNNTNSANNNNIDLSGTNLTPEQVFGRNLQDHKYAFFMRQEKKKENLKTQKKQEKMAFYNEMYAIKSKAMLLLEDDLIASLIK